MEISLTDITSRDSTLSGELQGLKNDIKMTERAVASQQNRWAENLRGTMGDDINDVLSGKKKVTVPFKLKVKYKLDKIINTILRVI